MSKQAVDNIKGETIFVSSVEFSTDLQTCTSIHDINVINIRLGDLSEVGYIDSNSDLFRNSGPSDHKDYLIELETVEMTYTLWPIFI